VVAVGYREGMTTLILIALGFVALCAVVVAYVAWRDRHRRGSITDPAAVREAQARVTAQVMWSRHPDVYGSRSSWV
jgi:uncharacterized iron-regulated membrane protein